MSVMDQRADRAVNSWLRRMHPPHSEAGSLSLAPPYGVRRFNEKESKHGPPAVVAVAVATQKLQGFPGRREVTPMARTAGRPDAAGRPAPACFPHPVTRP